MLQSAGDRVNSRLYDNADWKQIITHWAWLIMCHQWHRQNYLNDCLNDLLLFIRTIHIHIHPELPPPVGPLKHHRITLRHAYHTHNLNTSSVQKDFGKIPSTLMLSRQRSQKTTARQLKLDFNPLRSF